MFHQTDLTVPIESTGPLPDLRALAVLPQRDRLIFAINSKFGVTSFAEIRDKKLPLRIAISNNDGHQFYWVCLEADFGSSRT